jgi:hypothetical protein
VSVCGEENREECDDKRKSFCWLFQGSVVCLEFLCMDACVMHLV